MLKIIGNCFGRGFLRANRLKELRDKRRDARNERVRAKLLKEREQIEGILRLPEKHLTTYEFVLIPKDINLDTCPIGTWFVCKPFPSLPRIVVVGQVVNGGDLFTEQWGSGLSTPERGINRYRAIVIP